MNWSTWKYISSSSSSYNSNARCNIQWSLVGKLSLAGFSKCVQSASIIQLHSFTFKCMDSVWGPDLKWCLNTPKSAVCCQNRDYNGLLWWQLTNSANTLQILPLFLDAAALFSLTIDWPCQLNVWIQDVLFVDLFHMTLNRKPALAPEGENKSITLETDDSGT